MLTHYDICLVPIGSLGSTRKGYNRRGAQQLDAAENAASRAIDLVPEKGGECLSCQLHRVLGKIHQSKGEKEKAIHHLETALRIASPPNWHDELFWIHHALAELFLHLAEFDNANSHIEQAKSRTGGGTYQLGRAMRLQATVWCLQLRLEEAKAEALTALEIFEKFGVAEAAGPCRDLLQLVERGIRNTSPNFKGKLPETICFTSLNSHFLA